MQRDAYDPRFTGFMLTDAKQHMDCLRCGAKPGHRCHTPSGRKATTHIERMLALTNKFGPKYWSWTAPRNATP